MAEEDELELSESKGSGKKLVIILIGVILLLLVGGGVGAAYFMGMLTEEEATAEDVTEEGGVAKKKDAIYIPLDPAFTVNLQESGKSRFLQVSVQALTRESGVDEQIQKHGPVIRNNLVLLFSSKTAEELKTLQGKEKLQKEVLSTVQKVLMDATGEEGVEAVFFTSFVMQ
ncbi:MAG: flagellar basal body protein FliL [Gammaproteobacteria bacterium]|nr:flagellar basal body protein FliL [Gammaproteobacteria bacterium]